MGELILEDFLGGKDYQYRIKREQEGSGRVSNFWLFYWTN